MFPGNSARCPRQDKQQQGIIPTSKINHFGVAIWEQIPQEGQEKQEGLDHPPPGCPFSTARAAVIAIDPACGEVGSGPSSPPFLCPPPPSRSGKVGSLELVQLCKQDHGGEQIERHMPETAEGKKQVLLSLFNVQDQYLCNIHVTGLNICYRIKYFCTALVTSLASSAWGCW